MYLLSHDMKTTVVHSRGPLLVAAGMSTWQVPRYPHHPLAKGQFSRRMLLQAGQVSPLENRVHMRYVQDQTPANQPAKPLVLPPVKGGHAGCRCHLACELPQQCRKRVTSKCPRQHKMAVSTHAGSAVSRSGRDGGLPRARLLQHLDELLKAHVGVVRSGRGLGVVLDAHRLLRLAQQARACAVVQVDVGDVHVSREGLRVNRVIVVLRADLNPACAVEPTGVSTRVLGTE